ncbi:MAG: hypothetical protein U9Q15_01560 [Patescibacteria group bacterium]|nr:hypothetical protein [Patescibacteria group bacterium]
MSVVNNPSILFTNYFQDSTHFFMLQNTLSFFTVLSLVFTSNIALANDNPWDSWEDFVPEESLITEDNSSSISNTDVSEEKDTFFSYFKVRNAATITEHPSLNWEDSMWTAIKVSYDKGPHEVLPKENYEIRVYLEPKTGSLYFSPQYNSEMIAHHDISQRSPYVDNSDFRLASNDENQWSKNDSNYIVLIPTEDIQRGSPKTVLFRYTAPSQEDFDASILSTQITARIWTKNLDEKGEYTDNKKTTNFEIKNQRNSISIDGNISLPERNFFIVPNTEESTKVESINARLKNNRKFIQQDLTIKGYITNDVIQNTENYFYQTLATQTGVSIDTFQYKNIEFAFTPKLLDHINQQQYFLTLGVFDQSDNKIDEVTLPFEVRRDTVHLQTDWVSFYQYPDYIRGTIRTHNKGARSINDYS